MEGWAEIAGFEALTGGGGMSFGALAGAGAEGALLSLAAAFAACLAARPGRPDGGWGFVGCVVAESAL